MINQVLLDRCRNARGRLAMFGRHDATANRLRAQLQDAIDFLYGDMPSAPTLFTNEEQIVALVAAAEEYGR